MINNARISINPKISVIGGLLALKNLSEIKPYATQPAIPANVFNPRMPPASISE